jgi:catechol 2,3-dioxygenase-like lactoylglutathione lyase family enzyme
MADENVTQAVPFFLVNDIQASIRFYVDGLGFSMTQQWLDAGVLQWCWLQLGGAALMLQELRSDAPQRKLLPGALGVGVSIAFICRDALAIYHEARSRGLSPKQPFVGNAMWVTGFTDPDGYELFFESATDAPEESFYTGS